MGLLILVIFILGYIIYTFSKNPTLLNDIEEASNLFVEELKRSKDETAQITEEHKSLNNINDFEGLKDLEDANIDIDELLRKYNLEKTPNAAYINIKKEQTKSNRHIEKVRIYEIAKELDITSKEVITAANEIKIEVKSAQNAITVKQAESLKKYILDGSTQSFKENRKSKNKSIEKISIETINYNNAIRNIEVPNFEKVRRYCNNLVKNNQADAMQADLANNGKMHKALVYNALEQFIEQLQPNTIDIVDWGAGQGIYSMLIVDYIREKQLDINVGNVILIDNDATVLSRAMAQVNVLAQEDTNVSSLTMNKAKSIKDFKLGNIPLHIFVNDAIDMDLPKKAFEKEAYYMCLSNDNENFVQKIHTKISSLMNGSEIITNRKAKVGRFKKFEIIFKSPEISFFNIDEDEIPF